MARSFASRVPQAGSPAAKGGKPPGTPFKRSLSERAHQLHEVVDLFARQRVLVALHLSALVVLRAARDRRLELLVRLRLLELGGRIIRDPHLLALIRGGLPVRAVAGGALRLPGALRLLVHLGARR